MNRRAFLKLVGATMAVLGSSLQPGRAEVAVQHQEADLAGMEALFNEWDRAFVEAETAAAEARQAVNADGERILRHIHCVSDEMDTLLDTVSRLDSNIIWTMTAVNAGGSSLTINCGFKERG